jgi:FtsZ-binding cell division protein ZapB
LKNFTEFVESAVETALGQTKHVTSKLSESDKSKAALQAEITELKTQNSDLQAKSETAAVENKTLRKEVEDLKTETSTKRKLNDNQYIIELNPLKKQCFATIAGNPKVIELYEKLNKAGENDGFIDRLDSKNETENIIRMLSNLAVMHENSNLDNISTGKYPFVPIIGKNKIQKAFSDFKNTK